ncbi:integrase core domain-containing protein [Streptomyces sp. NPDC056237]
MASTASKESSPTPAPTPRAPLSGRPWPTSASSSGSSVPHCPWTDGKIECFNRTLQAEWADRQVFTSNTARSRALSPWPTFHNTRRRHTALRGRPPISRLSPTS